MKRPGQTYHHFLKTTSFLVILVLLSCGSKNYLSLKTILLDENPKLIFLNYTLEKLENGKTNIQFLNKIVAEGKQKSKSNKYLKTGNIGDLKCSQIDHKSKILQTIFIKNPFIKRVESINDSLQLESKQIETNKTSLSLRLQLDPRAKQIIISEIIDASRKTNTLYINKL